MIEDISFSGAIELKISGVHTATIGSFPLEDSHENRRRCVEDLIEIGVDFPNYPQLIEMGEQFLDNLVRQGCGIVRENVGYLLEKEDVGEPASPPGLEPYRWTVNYLKSKRVLEKVGLKASVTGPFTLASYVKMGKGSFPFNTAISDIEKVRQLANIISRSCRVFAEDAYVISVDEPVLSVIVGRKIFFKYDEGDIIDIYDDLKRSCGERITGTHVCGKLSPQLAKILSSTELDFLSHEFHDSPENFNVYDPKALEESGKVLSIGCVSSRNPTVETVDEVLKIMEKSKEYGDNLIFTPDCGFRPLKVNRSGEKGYQIARAKLRNLVEAADKFRSSI